MAWNKYENSEQEQTTNKMLTLTGKGNRSKGGRGSRMRGSGGRNRKKNPTVSPRKYRKVIQLINCHFQRISEIENVYLNGNNEVR